MTRAPRVSSATPTSDSFTKTFYATSTPTTFPGCWWSTTSPQPRCPSFRLPPSVHSTPVGWTETRHKRQWIFHHSCCQWAAMVKGLGFSTRLPDPKKRAVVERRWWRFRTLTEWPAAQRETNPVHFPPRAKKDSGSFFAHGWNSEGYPPPSDYYSQSGSVQRKSDHCPRSSVNTWIEKSVLGMASSRGTPLIRIPPTLPHPCAPTTPLSLRGLV